ncbi:Rossmann-fold NAD(P)-binding domain-containing protein [Pseudonocardia phyllosphaerae]|uniref:hypothetical protein n=1 Tax=Pseudonocardia phyllosphaerae TaxID=3390502 RepID=UPI0039792AD8
MELLVAPGAGLDAGRVSFLTPPDRVFQVIAVRDIGRIVAGVFGAPDRYAGRTFDIAGDAIAGRGLAEQLTRAAGRPIEYSRLTASLPAQDEALGRLAALFEDGRLAGHADLDALRAEFPSLLRFDDWLAGPGAPLLAAALAPAVR